MPFQSRQRFTSSSSFASFSLSASWSAALFPTAHRLRQSDDRRCRVGSCSAPRSLDLLLAALELACVKLLSRLFTALNLLPSMATLAFASSAILRHNSTNRAQTFLIAGPLSLRKSAMVL